jgi:hypothetical protein
VVLDPASGATLWSTGRRTDLVVVPGGLLADAGVRPVALLDPATGAPAARLAGWDVLGVDAGRMLLGAPSETGTVLGFHTGVTVTPFATVDAALAACELDGALIACETSLNEVVLLRMAT